MTTRRITNADPLFIVIILDESASMDESAEGVGMPKRLVMSSVVNKLLHRLVQVSVTDDQKRPIKPYFDLAVLGYGPGWRVRTVLARGGDGTWPAPDEPAAILSVRDLAAISGERKRDPRDGVSYRERVIPQSKGPTLTREAFLNAETLIALWLAKREVADGFPPVVFHVTDGELAPDDNPEAAVAKVSQLGTALGKTVVFNCHLGRQRAPAVVWSTDADAAAFRGEQRALFDLSSELPGYMVEAAHENGLREVKRGSRAYAFNASGADLTAMFNVGTRIQA